MTAIMTMKPVRIQRKRTRGWRMPENTVSVCRPGLWDNPFVVTPKYKPGRRVCVDYFAVPTAEDAAECYRLMCDERGPQWKALIQKNLRGKNLACFCKLGAPCHADVLLEFANE